MIKENKIIKVTKPVRLELLKDKFILPPEIQEKVDAYWTELTKKKPFYRREEAFTVSSICDKDDITEIRLAPTDYAHYIYTRSVGLSEEFAFNNIHTSCVIETVDEVLVFGLTGENTANTGISQCVGGGLDHDDIRGNEIDLEHNIKKELQEEVGVDVNNEEIASDFKFKYLNYAFNEKFSSIAAIFYLKLKLNEKEFRVHYEEFERRLKENGQVPEFQKLICLPKKEAAIQEFLRNSKRESMDLYMGALLREIISSEGLEIIEAE